MVLRAVNKNNIYIHNLFYHLRWGGLGDVWGDFYHLYGIFELNSKSSLRHWKKIVLIKYFYCDSEGCSNSILLHKITWSLCNLRNFTFMDSESEKGTTTIRKMIACWRTAFTISVVVIVVLVVATLKAGLERITKQTSN